MIHFTPIPYTHYDNFSTNNSINNVENNNINPYSTNNSFNFQAGNKSNIRNVFHENLLFTPKIIEDDHEVQRNISEQIKNVSFLICFYFLN